MFFYCKYWACSIYNSHLGGVLCRGDDLAGGERSVGRAGDSRDPNPTICHYFVLASMPRPLHQFFASYLLSTARSGGRRYLQISVFISRVLISIPQIVLELPVSTPTSILEKSLQTILLREAKATGAGSAIALTNFDFFYLFAVFCITLTVLQNITNGMHEHLTV